MKASEFGPDFVWGTSTASYQIEGAWNEDGKGESIWDRFSHKRGKIEKGQTGDVACDHYHRFESDLDLMASLGIKNYRLSLAWARIFPEGTGRVEERGTAFYNRVIDACLKRGITPWVTLYHWDLPQKLEDQGGWKNRNILGAFEKYVDYATRTYGDRVKKWMILNEPLVFTGGGYLYGAHAPGKRGFGNFLPAAHHAAMAQALGGAIARANTGGEIGTTFSMSHAEAWSHSKRDQHAMYRFDAVINRLFLDACVGRGYPVDAMPVLRKIEKHMQPGDHTKLKFDFDFIGVQNYTREVVQHSMLRPYIWLKMKSARSRGKKFTEMGWEVYPQGLYELLKKFGSYPEIKKLYVTENGAAFPDAVTGDRVADPERVAFLQSYIAQVLRAKREGINVAGYFVWSFLDNFEWAFGYRPRFGLVHVDFETQKRTAKDSALWYRDFIKGETYA